MTKITLNGFFNCHVVLKQHKLHNFKHDWLFPLDVHPNFLLRLTWLRSHHQWKKFSTISNDESCHAHTLYVDIKVWKILSLCCTNNVNLYSTFLCVYNVFLEIITICCQPYNSNFSLKLPSILYIKRCQFNYKALDLCVYNINLHCWYNVNLKKS